MRSPVGSCTAIIPGKLYRLRVSYGWDPSAKKRLELDVRFRGTERQARTELAKMISSVGRKAPVAQSKMLVSAFLDDEYLPHVRAHLKPHTVAPYESRVRCHIKPRIGHMRLDALTPRILDKMVEAMTEDGASEATIHHVYFTVRSALRKAVVWGWLEKDPTLGTYVPPMPDSEQPVLDLAGARSYLVAFAGQSDAELEIAVTLGLAGGMRRCEMCGTDWQQVDFDENVIDLTHGLGRHQLGAKVWDGPLKSKSSRRVVALPRFAMDILRKHRGLGRLIASNPDALSGRFAKAVADMKLTPAVTLESLRNAHGTIAYELGATMREIADQYGHKEEKVTADKYVRRGRPAGKRYAAKIQKMAPASSRKVPQVRKMAGDG